MGMRLTAIVQLKIVSCRQLPEDSHKDAYSFYLENIPFQPPEISRVMVIRIKGADNPAGAAR
jgi:hypothetical protein